MNEVTLLTHTIRPAGEDDYEAMADVGNRAYPHDDDQTDAETMRHWDRELPERCSSRRDVLEIDGRIVGFAHHRIPLDINHPGRYWLTIAVDPDHQGRGIGSALYNHVVAERRRDGLHLLRTACRDDMAKGLAFLRKNGFEEEERFWKSALDLTRFDASRFADEMKRVRKGGIEIKGWEDLRSEPNATRKLYEICQHVDRDMPMTETWTPISFEDWCKVAIENPKIVLGTLIVALDGDRYVGVTALQRNSPPEDRLWTMITGTHREYRRRGIAMAIKVASIARAKELGFRDLRTGNESTNRGMLSINERLGFRKLPVWITFVRKFGEETA